MVVVVPQFDSANETVSETLAIEQEHDSLGLIIDSRTAVTLLQGEPMDYNMAALLLWERALPSIELHLIQSRARPATTVNICY